MTEKKEPTEQEFSSEFAIGSQPVTAEDLKKRHIFANLLMKSLAAYINRTKDMKDVELIKAFCKQAIKDSATLVQGKIPTDIIEAAKARREKTCQ